MFRLLHGDCALHRTMLLVDATVIATNCQAPIAAIAETEGSLTAPFLKASDTVVVGSAVAVARGTNKHS